MKRRVPSDLDTTAKYWWTLQELSARYHVGLRMVQDLIRPHRGRCHLGRRGKHPRMVLWVPLEVVRALDRERRENMSSSISQEPPMQLTPATDLRNGGDRS